LAEEDTEKANMQIVKILLAMNTTICHCYEYNKFVILSAAKNLKAQILRYAQDDKLNLDEGRLHSFIVVRVRVVILSVAKYLALCFIQK